jgi:hypothetical protein
LLDVLFWWLFLQQPSIFSFACLLPTTINLINLDYLWYLDLGNSSGWPYLSNGVEALSSLEEQ